MCVCGYTHTHTCGYTAKDKRRYPRGLQDTLPAVCMIACMYACMYIIECICILMLSGAVAIYLSTLSY